MNMQQTDGSRQLVKISSISLSQTEQQIRRRKRFNKAAIVELGKSIIEHGQINPVVLRPYPADRKAPKAGIEFEMVAGERRYLGAESAGFDTVDSIVRNLTDEQVLEVQIIENIQREDVHPLEEAEGYDQLITKHGHRAEDLGEKIGKSKAYVYARLKLLELCKEAREAFYEDKINPSTALHVARIPVESLQKQALKEITDKRRPLSTRDAAEYIQREFMLRLDAAPFPTETENFVKGALACGRCPKNTTSQPELFGDIKAGSSGVCTDPTCFKAKSVRAIEVKVEAAAASGQEVISGKKAKEIFPYGTNSSAQGGFVKLDGEIYVGGKNIKVKSLMGTDVVPALVKARVSDYGRERDREVVIEVVSQKDINVALKAKGIKRNEPNGRSAPARKESSTNNQAFEKLFRATLLKQLLEKAPTKLDRKVVERYVVISLRECGEDLDIFDAIGVPVSESEKKSAANRGYRAEMKIAESKLRKLTDPQLIKLMTAQPFVGLLNGFGMATDLLIAAKASRIDHQALRKKLQAEIKAAAKAKKATKKK